LAVELVERLAVTDQEDRHPGAGGGLDDALASKRRDVVRGVAEARKNLREAVKLVVEANRELARQAAEGRDVKREKLLVAV
jgi:hypothetical protein